MIIETFFSLLYKCTIIMFDLLTNWFNLIIYFRVDYLHFFTNLNLTVFFYNYYSEQIYYTRAIYKNQKAKGVFKNIR